MSRIITPYAAAVEFENDPFAIFYVRAWRHVNCRVTPKHRRRATRPVTAAVAALASELPTVLEARKVTVVDGVEVSFADERPIRLR